jgi:hypothetical protein
MDDNGVIVFPLCCRDLRDEAFIATLDAENQHFRLFRCTVEFGFYKAIFVAILKAYVARFPGGSVSLSIDIWHDEREIIEEQKLSDFRAQLSEICPVRQFRVTLGDSYWEVEAQPLTILGVPESTFVFQMSLSTSKVKKASLSATRLPFA